MSLRASVVSSFGEVLIRCHRWQVWQFVLGAMFQRSFNV
jgi:hypothetical protein